MTKEAPPDHRRRLEALGELIERGAMALWPERGPAEVKAVGNWRATGKWDLMAARVRFADGAERLTVSSGDAGRLRKLFDREYGSMPAIAGRAGMLEPEGMMFESFPADWKLPGLRHALNAQTMARLLDSAGLLAPGADQAGAVDVRVRRYLAHKRAVFLYSFQGAAGPASAVAKLYSSDERSERAFEVLQQIQAAGEPGRVAPKPYALRKEWSLVVMERFHGEPLEHLIDEHPGDAETREAVRQTARSLALLHQVPASGIIERAWWEEASLLLEEASASSGSTAVKIAEVLSALVGLDLPEEPLVFAHGDFNPRQVLWHHGGAYIVDLDRGAAGEASADVGRFVASLKGRLASTGNEAFRDLATVFEKEYEAVAGRDVIGRSAAQEATAILHRAVRQLRYGRPERAEAADRLADEARETLHIQGLI